MKLSVNEISKIYSALNSERYNIGDTVWFVASCIEPMRLSIEYSNYTISDTNATYRLVSIPIKGVILSVYVNHYAVAYSNGIPNVVPTGGTRFNKDDIQDMNKYYDPKHDTISYEIKTVISPGVIRPPIISYTDLYNYKDLNLNKYSSLDTYSALDTRSSGLIPFISSKTRNLFFANTLARVSELIVGSTPEEAEKKYLVSSIYHVRNLNKLSHKNDSYSRAQLRRFTVANLCDV